MSPKAPDRLAGAGGHSGRSVLRCGWVNKLFLEAVQAVDRLAEFLPHWNATLNLVALLLLWTGRRWIRQGRETAHRRAMLAAFATSTLFLASYLLYHYLVGGGRRFPDYPPAAVRVAYLAMLASHVILAAGVPFLAAAAVWLGWRDRRAAHRRLVRWAYPIWVYVSLTGVLVYLALYQIFPPIESPTGSTACVRLADPPPSRAAAALPAPLVPDAMVPDAMVPDAEPAPGRPAATRPAAEAGGGAARASTSARRATRQVQPSLPLRRSSSEPDFGKLRTSWDSDKVG